LIHVVLTSTNILSSFLYQIQIPS